jgi:adenylate kinase family enzyme
VTRVVIVGGPGSGKTTFAAALAQRLGCEHVELDSLWWQPDWTPSDPATFRARVDDRLRGAASWVVDGNYFDEVAATLWPAADTIVWLAPPRPIAFARACRRSVGRITRRTPLWNGNVEVVTNFSPMSLVRLWRSWPARDARIAAEVARGDLTSVRLQSDAEARAWLAAVSVA